MDYKLQTNGQGRLDVILGVEDTVINNIIYSLIIEKGSWWFDLSLGSDLHLLRRAKATARTASTAKAYILAALKWMVECGKIEQPTVVVSIKDKQLLYSVTARQIDGQEISYSNFIEVA